MRIPKQTVGVRRYAIGDRTPACLSAVAPAMTAIGTGAGSLKVRSLGFSCSPFGCVCTGDADCNDMFTTNVCGSGAICIDNVCWCSR